MEVYRGRPHTHVCANSPVHSPWADDWGYLCQVLLIKLDIGNLELEVKYMPIMEALPGQIFTESVVKKVQPKK